MLQIRCDTKIENHISNFAEIRRRNGIIDIYIHLIAISVIVPPLIVRLPTNNDNEFEIISFVSYISNGNK